MGAPADHWCMPLLMIAPGICENCPACKGLLDDEGLRKYRNQVRYGGSRPGPELQRENRLKRMGVYNPGPMERPDGV